MRECRSEGLNMFSCYLNLPAHRERERERETVVRCRQMSSDVVRLDNTLWLEHVGTWVCHIQSSVVTLGIRCWTWGCESLEAFPKTGENENFEIASIFLGAWALAAHCRFNFICVRLLWCKMHSGTFRVCEYFILFHPVLSDFLFTSAIVVLQIVGRAYRGAIRESDVGEKLARTGSGISCLASQLSETPGCFIVWSFGCALTLALSQGSCATWMATSPLFFFWKRLLVAKICSVLRNASKRALQSSAICLPGDFAKMQPDLFQWHPAAAWFSMATRERDIHIRT